MPAAEARDHDYKYSWDEFVVPARDQKGQSGVMTYRLQPAHQRQMDVFVGMKVFPYRTVGDLMRHALKRHLEWLETQEGAVVSMLAMVDEICYMVRDDQFYGEMEGVFRTMADRCQKHLELGDLADARKIMARIRGKLDQIPDMGWKDRYVRYFQNRFAPFLTPGQDAPSNVVSMMHIGSGNGIIRSVRQDYTESDLDAG